MPLERSMEVVPHRLAEASHCGPLIRQRFHSMFTASPQPRARSRPQSGDWGTTSRFEERAE